MKVTFVVPVYKVEAYLRQCVESLTHQTYRDIEVILVDDGSPDESPQLCDTLVSEDPRIKVIHKENGGLSDARNAGLLEASGDYVVFVDGDDFWMDDSALQHLIDAVNPELDFIGYNCSYYYPDSGNYSSWVAYDDILGKATDKNTVMVTLVKSGTFPMSACMKLMKRSFLIENQLFFKKGQIAEDIPWFINVLDATNKCCFVNQYIYAYRQNVVGSISNTRGRKSFDHLFDVFKTELSLVESRSFNEEAKNALKSFLAYEYCILLTYKDIDKKTKRELLNYKDILTYDLNPKVKKASRIYKTFGISATTFALNVYQWMRRNRK
jgi:glycosyltransferase involved in cell wall biosynthesis